MKRTGKKASQKKDQRGKSKARWLQNWVAEKVSLLLDIPWGLDELIEARRMGHAGVDVVLRGEAAERFRFSIECASGDTVNWVQKIRQAKKNTKPGTEWLLFLKRSTFRAPVVILDANLFFALMQRIIVLERKCSKNSE